MHYFLEPLPLFPHDPALAPDTDHRARALSAAEAVAGPVAAAAAAGGFRIMGTAAAACTDAARSRAFPVPQRRARAHRRRGLEQPCMGEALAVQPPLLR